MKQQSIIEINHFNPHSRGKILPHQPILSSKELNWDGMVFNHYKYRAFEVSEHTQANHSLGMFLNEAYMEEKLNGKLFSHDKSFGSSNIIPCGQSYAPAWKEKLGFIIVSVKPRRLSKFAPESINPDSIELKACLGVEPDPLIRGILMNFKQEIATSIEPNDILIEHLQNALLAHLLQNYCSKKFQLKKFNGLPPNKLKVTLDYINDNLHRAIKLGDIARLIDISPGYFSRLFRESMSIPPHQYILQRRVEIAQQLIDKNRAKLSLKEIAHHSGFKSASHFSRRFTQVTGLSPSRYRDSL